MILVSPEMFEMMTTRTKKWRRCSSSRYVSTCPMRTSRNVATCSSRGFAESILERWGKAAAELLNDRESKSAATTYRKRNGFTFINGAN